MCGISVIVDSSASAQLLDKLLAMHSVIGHRGPDGEGFLLAGAQGDPVRAAAAGALRPVQAPVAGFAFRRLRICDLSEAAAQPMGSADGRTWIVFNGEVYNYQALRRELEASGRAFVSHGDTEVVLAAYEAWGEECFARFEGMWAIAILDLRRDRLVLSRDRFGIKPLFWMRDAGGALMIASEIKQLLAAGSAQARANRPLVEMFLRASRYPATEETFFEGIRAVPPATWAEVSLAAPGEPRFRPYWRLDLFTSQANRLSYREAVDRVEDVLARAVESHGKADVKVGALLSGGLDSSTIVALTGRNGGQAPPTYSFGLRGAAPSLCEMGYVDAMVRAKGIANRETTLDYAWAAANVDRVLWALEEPPLALAPFAQFRVFELCAQDGATVVLDGQGADEIAAGYPYHQRAFVRDRLVHGRAIAGLAELRAIGRRQHTSAARVFDDLFMRSWLRARPDYPWIAPAGARTRADEFEFARADFGNDPSGVNRKLYFDVRWGNVKIVLGYGDRNAMAHSVEARVPYFDRTFVELLFSLPDDYKIGNGDRKRVLRDVARRHVPPEITERADRIGYGTPDESLISGSLGPIVAEAVNDPAFLSSGWVDADATRRFYLDFQRGFHHDYPAIWRLFALSRWARRFDVRN